MHCKEANKQHKHSSLQHTNASLRQVTNGSRDTMLGFCQISVFSVGWNSRSQEQYSGDCPCWLASVRSIASHHFKTEIQC